MSHMPGSVSGQRASKVRGELRKSWGGGDCPGKRAGQVRWRLVRVNKGPVVGEEAGWVAREGSPEVL